MKSPRNYKKEYKRRIALAKTRSKALGRSISRSQARGHARPAKGEMSITGLKRNRIIKPWLEATVKRYYRALRNFLEGKSVTAAAKAAGMAPATLKRIGTAQGVIEPVEARLRPRPGSRGYDLVQRSFIVITSGGQVHKDVPFDRGNAGTMGAYWNAARDALARGSDAPLKPFKGQAVTDLSGRKYRLMVSFQGLLTIKDLMSPEEAEAFDNPYRKIRRAA